MSRRILVTGANGLIGNELLPLLASGSNEILALGRSAAELPNYCRCDLADPQATAEVIARLGPDVVIHLAGGAAATRHDLFRDNVLATVHLLEAAARLPAPPYCIVLGSAAEYGNADGGPIAENAPLRPVTEYGRAKVAQTTLAQVLAAERRIPLTVLRPFNVVSPQLPAHTALGSMRRQLLAASGPDCEIRCGRLDIVRDYVPVGSVAEAVRRLVDRPAPGRVLNVCSGVGIELGAVLAAMARRLAVECRVAADPELVALPAVRSVVGDPTVLRAVLALAITPTPESLAEVLLRSSSPPSCAGPGG